MGLDQGESQWIEVQRGSLDRHIEALENLKSSNLALIEFGEFLNRPVGITQRITWR
jgi:hypothetical protein